MMNFKSLNSRQYERYLSPFGTQVLQNLIKSLEERNECNKIQIKSRYNYSENKRTLNFSDSHISPSVTEYRKNASVNQSHDNVSVKNNDSVKLPITVSSHGLLEATDEGAGTADRDKGQSVANNNDAVHLPATLVTNVEESSNERISDNIIIVKDSITWDEIFDTQLLNDLHVLDTESNMKAQEPQCDKVVQDISAASKNLNVDANVSEYGDIKKGKTKRQSSDGTSNTITKKPKNLPAKVPKNSFRKQKYTKVVKTWLSRAEHEHLEQDLELQNNKETNVREITLESIEPNVKMNTKKIIQAQLTNKDGVMKFAKPKHNELSAEPKDVTTETIINTKVKEKKAKARFKAPIKPLSQLPVNNVHYNIIHLNDDNYNEYGTELSAIHDKEIPMVLIFSNGFCQLTGRCRDDTFVVEGAMFAVNDVYYYWNHVYTSFCGTMEKIINRNSIVCYDGKNLLKYFASRPDIHIINTEVKVLDLQVGGNLVDPSNPPENFTNLRELLRRVPEEPATECVQRQCAPHLAALAECFGALRAVLVDHQLWKVFVEIEMPVLPIVAEMEAGGVRVDTSRLRAMEGRLRWRLVAAERACHAAAGRAFCVNSALQVRAVLYDDLQLDRRTDVAVKETLCKGEKSTSESVLRSLMAVHPLPKLILEYRHVQKAHATFVAGIANQVKDGVVRPTWEQAAAVTGRIACNNPNLQAIPKTPFSLALFPPDTQQEEHSMAADGTFNFRSVYVPSEGRVLLAADFKHIECRVFAYAAADTGLLDALASPDLFRVLAAKWLNTEQEAVSAADRERTKRIVYASLYGAGRRRLMDMLGVSYERALAVHASFNGTFPALRSFGRAVVAECARRGGRLATLCGRARAFPRVFSADSALRAQAERQAVNFVVQGSAADLCKMAMVETQRRLRGARPALRAALLLQVHDELVWEVERRDLGRAAEIVRSAMEGIGQACGVAVPLPVTVSAGPSWGEMEELRDSPGLSA